MSSQAGSPPQLQPTGATAAMAVTPEDASITEQSMLSGLSGMSELANLMEGGDQPSDVACDDDGTSRTISPESRLVVDMELLQEQCGDIRDTDRNSKAKKERQALAHLDIFLTLFFQPFNAFRFGRALVLSKFITYEPRRVAECEWWDATVKNNNTQD